MTAATLAKRTAKRPRLRLVLRGQFGAQLAALAAHMKDVML